MRALAGLLAVQLILLMTLILWSNHAGKKKLTQVKVFNHETSPTTFGKLLAVQLGHRSTDYMQSLRNWSRRLRPGAKSRVQRVYDLWVNSSPYESYLQRGVTSTLVDRNAKDNQGQQELEWLRECLLDSIVPALVPWRQSGLEVALPHEDVASPWLTADDNHSSLWLAGLINRSLTSFSFAQLRQNWLICTPCIAVCWWMKLTIQERFAFRHSFRCPHGRQSRTLDLSGPCAPDGQNINHPTGRPTDIRRR